MLLQTLLTARPHHDLLAADFHELPDVTIAGRNAPLVATTVSCFCWLRCVLAELLPHAQTKIEVCLAPAHDNVSSLSRQKLTAQIRSTSMFASMPSF